VEGAAARAAKSLNAGRGDGPTAVTEPDRSQSPRCPCKAPPKFYHPWSGSIAGGRLPTICRFGGRLVQMRSGESRGWRPPRLTKWSRAGLISCDGEGFKFGVAIFVAARLRPRLSNHHHRPPAPWIGSPIEPLASERD